MIVRGTLRRVVIALLISGALLLAPPLISGGTGWNIAIALGYVSAVLLLCLYLFPVRADGLPHARLFGLSQHKAIGWAVLATTLLHVATLLVAQPSVGRYLLPSAPVYMWCGMLAAILAAALIQTGLASRSAMRRSGSTAAANIHVVLAAVMIVVLCAHMFASGQLIRGPLKTAVVTLLFALPVAWFAVRPRKSARKPLRRAVHVAAAASVAFIPASITQHTLLEPVTRPAAIFVNFPHDRHTSVNCVACHHNYVDHTGTMACIECHRSQRADLGRASESTFHTLCRDCHMQLADEGRRHGPMRACSECHQAAVATAREAIMPSLEFAGHTRTTSAVPRQGSLAD